MKLINIGFGNAVNADRILAVAGPESAPIKRIVQEAKEQKMLIDATQGRKTRAVIITDSNHVILTYLQAETIMARFNDDSDKEQAYWNKKWGSLYYFPARRGLARTRSLTFFCDWTRRSKYQFR